MLPSTYYRSSLALALCGTTACTVASSHRLSVAPTLAPRNASLTVRIGGDSAAAPRGDQMVAGWMGSVVGGFLAWRIFDEPDGRHAKVKNGWGYTPKALTALAVGSHVGSTTGVWLRGYVIGSKGSVLLTAAGAALPTIGILARRDDPLLMLKLAAAWGPLQSYMAYTGYRVGARGKAAGRPTDPVVVKREDARPRKSGNVIAKDELTRVAYTNAYDAISQMRPHWLASARQRSPTENEAAGQAGTIVVYLDGTRLGAMESLRQIALSDVAEIEYFDAREATNRFGTGHPAGAINVRRTLGAR